MSGIAWVDWVVDIARGVADPAAERPDVAGDMLPAFCAVHVGAG
jgi:hypothetical protein